MSQRLWDRLSLLWDVPIGLGSLAAFQIYKRIMRSLMVRHYGKLGPDASRWRPLSSDSIRKPFMMPVLMATAPRWNPHALIATAGPLNVTHSLTIDRREADRSANSWTAVVYEFPSFRTCQYLGSLDTPADLDRDTLNLPSGQYLVGVRYYGSKSHGMFPAIDVDGKPVVASEPIPPGMNDFYETLAARRGLGYRWLHFHAYAALKHQTHLPRSWVERVVLPVGNPDTRFVCSVVPQSKTLSIQNLEQLPADTEVYLALYSRSSLPVYWTQVRSDPFLAATQNEPCMAVVRVRSGRLRSSDDLGLVFELH